MFPKKCFCCVDLRLGTTFMAITEIALFTFLLYWSLAVAKNVDWETTLGEDKEIFDPQGFTWGLYIFAIVAVANIVTNVLLIYGTLSKYSWYLWQWLWVSITTVQFQFIVSCVLYWVYYHLSKGVNLWLIILSYFVLFGKMARHTTHNLTFSKI